MSKQEHLDLASFRARLEHGDENRFWRSLEELSNDEAFDEFVKKEFPHESQTLGEGVDRRDFLKLMSASLALGGLTACTRPLQQILPYVRQPEDVIPGKPLFFATAMSLAGSSAGVLVESHLNRPTRIEGNPDHPSSMGATDAFMQASILSLYDPDRSQTVRYIGDPATYGDFLGALSQVLVQLRSKGGAGLRILTESINSPTLGNQFQTLLSQYPKAVWHQYEAAGRENVLEGTRLAFGAYVNPVYQFDKADVVVSLDGDFLTQGSGHLRYARDFMGRRKVRLDKQEMNRLYVVESMLTGTGSVADHRLPMRSADVESFARALAAQLGVSGGAPPSSSQADFVAAVARDLQAHRGKSIVVAGEHQPPVVHAIAFAINGALGNAGSTVYYTDPIEESPIPQTESMRQLAHDMETGAVEALIIIGGNPVFAAPADLNFAHGLERVPFRAHLSHYYDETSALCQWHVPRTHYLEEWSDARAHDGTVSIVQPLIAPLYGGRSAHELLGVMTGEANEAYEVLRGYWRSKLQSLDFEKSWRKALNDGVVAGSTLPVKAMAAGGTLPPPTQNPGGLELVFKSDPTIFDGRFANNAWLEELPHPMTKLTWDNAALVSPRTAAKLEMGTENYNGVSPLAEISYKGRTLQIPIWVVPGHADDSVTLHFGRGRTRAGNVGTAKGFNVYAIRTSDAPSLGFGAAFGNLKETRQLACTQLHQSIDVKTLRGERDIIRVGTIEQFRRDPSVVPETEENKVRSKETFYPPFKYEGYAWGMSIDTNLCTGCGGCVIACQSENNIPVVGKDQVIIGRAMHWLRIDHYYRGRPENPESYHIPILCMHCENAPCEPVCPVEATSHSPEGINEMTYNRCVGTKYCANNCPYKVRRFNWYSYSEYDIPGRQAIIKGESFKAMRNPNVTVRSRGVMEKCSYCVQRVNAARQEAEKGDRRIRDGEVVTACQSACPGEAIVFGDINDKTSRVAARKAQPANYGLLTELNTQPRTTYLPTLKNPNPEIKAG
ncbi:MAG TPA: TAT-variant-translocated molybdopterin oxidoreductase [Thermoanaerobaculia bacterium]|nr:TAT-variant-translocated molybdopterin oxidoreductase [Thermoanaerobaculia bacterium]